ncbi:hypothetical protein [Cellulomonas sp.]|uniref:hypothetical protein n=1 Tax=Cellulomonas sp. TaxID=40001 RepID=UPI001AFE469E|nr:hypothetical protein [Cellulomonas sp.]MBO9553608.1 hypothetical protein [Cellulomonas sp.]
MKNLATVLSTAPTTSTYAADADAPSALSAVGTGVAILGVLLLVSVSLGASALIRRGHRPLRWFGASVVTMLVGFLVMWIGGTR